MWFVGIDVSASRGNAIAMIGKGLRVSRLFSGIPSQGVGKRIFMWTQGKAVIGVDAPRMPSKGKGWGRKCEKELSSLGFRPLWTPPGHEFQKPPAERKPSCLWMEQGFRIYGELERFFRKQDIIEVFPSSAYRFFGSVTLTIDFNLFTRKNKADELDAICAALVAYSYHNGEFTVLGDEEEGRIVIPGKRRIP